MARKEISVTLEKGRDAGKRFLITEMSAMQAEKWATRLLMAAFGADGFDMAKFGAMSNIASAGVKILSQIPFEVAEPLLEEMLSCIQIMPNPKDPTVRRAIDADDIEEIASLFKLRTEVLKLHIDFFTNAAE